MGVNVNRREPKNWGALGFRSLRMGGVGDPKKHAPRPHGAEGRRSVLNGVGMNREPHTGQRRGGSVPLRWVRG